MAIQITIPITPVTKKNHQQIMRSSKTGKPFVMPSAEYRQYEAQAVWHCKRAAISAGVHKPIDTPCEVRCLFYMPSRRRVDLTNLLESPWTMRSLPQVCWLTITARSSYRTTGAACYTTRTIPARR